VTNATVNPTTRKPEADLALFDGVTTLNLMLCRRNGTPDPAAFSIQNAPNAALRISQGNGGYNDMELPFSSQVMNDFSGGRGNRDFERDTTRFAESYRADTLREVLRCGPMETFGTTGMARLTKTGVTEALQFFKYGAFYPGAGLTRSLTVRIKATGPMKGSGSEVEVINLVVCPDTGANAPNRGSVLAQASLSIAAADADYRDYTFPINYTFAAATRYWVGIQANYGIAWSYLEYGYYAGTDLKHYDMDRGEWIVDVVNAQYVLTSKMESVFGRSIFFDYKGMKMMVTAPADGTTPRLFVNGFFGGAADNSGDKTKTNANASTTIPSNLSGKIVKIVSGPGSEEMQNWRLIVSNTTGVSPVLTVAPAWTTTHTTSTHFYVSGCDNWTEIAGHNMPLKPVTSVLVVNDIIYFAFGEGTNIRRGQFTASGGWSWADDGTNQMTYLVLVQDDKGVQKIWGAKAAACTVAEAVVAAWGTSLTFDGTPITCGSTNYKITNLIGAKLGGYMMPTVMKENGFGAVASSGSTKIFDWFRRFDEVADENNGRAAIVHDVYLWFSLLEGIERFYDQRLDDIGPNKDQGLSSVARGPISAMVEYANRVYVAVDAGPNGYSSVLCHNGIGWHDVYQGDPGWRIQSLAIQVIPSTSTPDRLWIGSGESVLWLPLALNPDQQDGYKYTNPTTLTTSRMYTQYIDLNKCFARLTIFTRNLAIGHQVINVYARVDSGSMITIATLTTSPVQEVLLQNTGVYLTGRYIEFHFELYTDDPTKTPIIESIRLDSVVRVPVKDTIEITAKLVDGYTVNKQGARVNLSVKSQFDQLRTWQNSNSSPGPLTLSFVHSLLDGVQGFVDSGSLMATKLIVRPESREIEAIVSFKFIEV
jgi:hypothetical protein